MTKNEDISNPFQGTERKTLPVQSIVDKKVFDDFIFQSALHPFGYLSKFPPRIFLAELGLYEKILTGGQSSFTLPISKLNTGHDV